MQDRETINAKARESYRRRKAGLASQNAGRPANTPEVLWSKVDIKSPDDCWEWKGWIGAGGYGRTQINGMSYYAHRVIFDLANPNTITLAGPKNPKAFGFLMHTCDNPPCCNPKHLVVGDHKKNMEDKVSKGRSADFSGDKGPRCKLTMDQVRQARQMKQNGISTKKLAELFNISLASMKSLIRGDSYKEQE